MLLILFLITRALRWIDIWMCNRPRSWQFRIWWQFLWNRADEFHTSTDPDYEAMLHMTPQERRRYETSVVRRRNRLHFHTLGP